MKVKNAMVPIEKLVIASQNDTISDCMKKMIENNVGSIIVSEDRKNPLGIVTASDVIHALHNNKEKGFELKLKDVMSMDLVTVNENDELKPTIVSLENAKTHHLIAVDDNNKLAGIFSSFDVVREYALDVKAHPWIRN